MSSFTMKPWPSVNPTNFSKFIPSREIVHHRKKGVVQRSCEGENNGESYKIKGTSTPCVIEHLEKQFGIVLPEKHEKDVRKSKKDQKPKKREGEEFTEQPEDPNEPSTSSAVPRKKARPSQ